MYYVCYVFVSVLYVKSYKRLYVLGSLAHIYYLIGSQFNAFTRILRYAAHMKCVSIISDRTAMHFQADRQVFVTVHIVRIPE